MGFLLLENGDKLLLESGDRLLLEDGAPGGSAPTAPSGLTATAVSSSAIYLEWTDNSGDETGFELQRSADGSTGWTTVATTSAGVVSATDAGLSSETQYFYRVRATNGFGDSSWSSAANATTLALSVSTGQCGIESFIGCGGSSFASDVFVIGE